MDPWLPVGVGNKETVTTLASQRLSEFKLKKPKTSRWLHLEEGSHFTLFLIILPMHHVQVPCC